MYGKSNVTYISKKSFFHPSLFVIAALPFLLTLLPISPSFPIGDKDEMPVCLIPQCNVPSARYANSCFSLARSLAQTADLPHSTDDLSICLLAGVEHNITKQEKIKK